MNDVRNIVSGFIEAYDPRKGYIPIEELIKKLEVVLLKAKEAGKREMLDLLEQRLLIGPSDYDRMVVELETGVSDWD